MVQASSLLEVFNNVHAVDSFLDIYTFIGLAQKRWNCPLGGKKWKGLISLQLQCICTAWPKKKVDI